MVAYVLLLPKRFASVVRDTLEDVMATMGMTSRAEFHSRLEKRGVVLFIAEVKTYSRLSGYRSTVGWRLLLDIAASYGHMVSVHTHPWWDGSIEKLREARKVLDQIAEHCRPKLLAKGLHENDLSIRCAFDAGADYALVVGRIPKMMDSRIFVEPSRYPNGENPLELLKRVPCCYTAVWNSRDIASAIDLYRRGKRSPHHIQNPISFETARRAWSDGSARLIQASNIKTIDDIAPGASGILVGTHLLSFIESV